MALSQMARYIYEAEVALPGRSVCIGVLFRLLQTMLHEVSLEH